MVRFTIFSGHEAPLGSDGDIYVTIFAGADLQRPPVAALAARTTGGPSSAEPHVARYTFLTLFGGVEIRWPTLADEYVALRDALRGGVLTLPSWDRFFASHSEGGGVRINTVTLFGSCNGGSVPSEDKELDDLALHRHLGHISDAAVQLLLPAIGQTGAVRLAAIRQAVAAVG